jgi:methionyl aminopeptidase
MSADAPRQCSSNECENDAGALQCPNCQKLGKESYFCSQDCFKRNWVHSKNSQGQQAKLSDDFVE